MCYYFLSTATVKKTVMNREDTQYISIYTCIDEDNAV